MKGLSILCLILAVALVVFIALFAGEKKKATEEVSCADAVIENIMTRSSVRTYLDKAVGEEEITTLLKAGMAAPSAADRRPWHFIVVTDKDQLQGLSVANHAAGFAARAPLAIVVCGDLSKALEGEAREMWAQDLSAATENILLAAHAIGLGATWTGVYPITERVEGVTQVLNLPEGIIPLNIIVIGYPAGEPNIKDKWDESCISHNRYGE